MGRKRPERRHAVELFRIGLLLLVPTICRLFLSNFSYALCGLLSGIAICGYLFHVLHYSTPNLVTPLPHDKSHSTVRERPFFVSLAATYAFQVLFCIIYFRYISSDSPGLGIGTLPWRRLKVKAYQLPSRFAADHPLVSLQVKEKGQEHNFRNEEYSNWPVNSEGDFVVERLSGTSVLPQVTDSTPWAPASIQIQHELSVSYDMIVKSAQNDTSVVVADIPKLYWTPMVSIVMASHNEHKYLERTLDSLVNSTHPKLLHEIIVVDDASSPPMESAYNSSKYREGLVKFVTNEERKGLINSKHTGGHLAVSEILIFLDPHVKPDPGWLAPIFMHINENYKRVVVPKIPVLDGDTWVLDRNAYGTKMMFNWNLEFHWINSDDSQWVPCMSGGLLAMSKRWFVESGGLDPTMEQWGSENIEQSVRTWLCGGEIVVATDSVIGHVFRTSFPYSIDNVALLRNKFRAVDPWWDEYKHMYYDTLNYASVKRNIEQLESDLQQRREVRERLQCKGFQWYVDRFSDVFFDQGMIERESFLLRNPELDSCLSFNKAAEEVTLLSCDRDDANQQWAWRSDSSTLGNVGQGTCVQIRKTSRAVGPSKKDGPVSNMHSSTCSSTVRKQDTVEVSIGRIFYGSLCLTIAATDLGARYLFFKVCEGTHAEGTTLEGPTYIETVPDQHFEKTAVKNVKKKK
eukprot:Lankesteria_metandrocarpae@DN4367_c0_g1_i1.p1